MYFIAVGGKHKELGHSSCEMCFGADVMPLGHAGSATKETGLAILGEDWTRYGGDTNKKYMFLLHFWNFCVMLGGQEKMS